MSTPVITYAALLLLCPCISWCFQLKMMCRFVVILTMTQCFSIGVLWDPRVPSVASKGSAKSNQDTGTKWHLRPLDAFSGLLVHPKIYLQLEFYPEPRWESLQHFPDPLASREGQGFTAQLGGTHCPSPITPFPLSAFGLQFWASQVTSAPPPPRQNPGYVGVHGFREQSKLLKMVPIQRKGW